MLVLVESKLNEKKIQTCFEYIAQKSNDSGGFEIL
jgi:hypothetical protein